jgi:hypothetical protein
MLIKFFKSSYLIQYFFLVLVTAAIWIPGFIANPGLPVEPNFITPLYNIIHFVLIKFNIASPAAALVIVVISAFTLNNILVYHELTPKNNLLPAFLFILFMGSDPHTLCSYPLVLSLPFLTWFIHTMFKVNDEPEDYMAVFNASFLVSIISMIYPAAMILYACIWIMLLVFGTITGRNLIVSFIGLLLPYLYLFLYFFWTDQLDEAMIAYMAYLSQIFHFRLNSDIWQFTIWAIFILFMLFPSFTRITSTLGSFSINFRKKMTATGWLLAFTFPMILFQGQVDYHSLIFLPASIMVAHYYHLFKRSAWNEIALLLFLLSVLAHNYLQLLNA